MMKHEEKIIEIYNKNNFDQYIPQFRDTVLQTHPDAAEYIDTVLSDDNIKEHILHLIKEREDVIYRNFYRMKKNRTPKYVGENEYEFVTTDEEYHESIYTSLENDILHYQHFDRLIYAEPLHTEAEIANCGDITVLDKIAYDILVQLKKEEIIKDEVDSYLLISDNVIDDCLRYYPYSDGEQPEVIRKYFRKEFLACLPFIVQIP